VIESPFSFSHCDAGLSLFLIYFQLRRPTNHVDGYFCFRGGEAVDKVFEGVSAFLSAVGPAGYPTSLLGGVLMLFYYLRRSEAGLRSELVSSLQRLQKDKEALQTRIDALQAELDEKEEEFDRFRAANRGLEDKAYNESRRAEDLLDQLRKIKRSKESD
jgi:hypothetical protein